MECWNCCIYLLFYIYCRMLSCTHTDTELLKWVNVNCLLQYLTLTDMLTFTGTGIRGVLASEG